MKSSNPDSNVAFWMPAFAGMKRDLVVSSRGTGRGRCGTRNDGQGIGLLVSACRLSRATVRRGVDKAIDPRRLDAPDRHIHPNLPNLETAPGAVDDALERADLDAANPPLQGGSAIERHHGPTVPAPPRYRLSQLSSLERGGKLSCPQSLENTQNRKIHETAPGAVDDVLERTDLNPADRPLEEVGAIERDQAPSVAGPSRYQPSQSSPPFERGGNFPGRKALKIHKTAKESRFDSILSGLRFPSRNGHRRCPIIAASNSIVIASAAKQSRGHSTRPLDCFVARAPRNDAWRYSRSPSCLS
jgi:hypothetical protein